MKQRISIITLPTDDVARAHRFYRDGLGFPAGPVGAAGDHFVISCADGLSLVLFARAALDASTGAPSSGAGGVVLSWAAADRAAVTDLIARAESAGGRRLGVVSDHGWGAHGHFADPDGHVWEAVWFKDGATV